MGRYKSVLMPLLLLVLLVGASAGVVAQIPEDNSTTQSSTESQADNSIGRFLSILFLVVKGIGVGVFLIGLAKAGLGASGGSASEGFRAAIVGLIILFAAFAVPWIVDLIQWIAPG